MKSEISNYGIELTVKIHTKTFILATTEEKAKQKAVNEFMLVYSEYLCLDFEIENVTVFNEKKENNTIIWYSGKYRGIWKPREGKLGYIKVQE